MAGGDFKMKGTKKFMRNLNKEIRNLETRSLKGLIKGAIIIQRSAEPETPIDIGNLRASWFIVTVRSQNEAGAKLEAFEGDDSGNLKRRHSEVKAKAQGVLQTLSSPDEPMVMFGYSANYAVFVHENISADFKRAGAKARWLYAAMRKNHQRILNAIQNEAKF